MSIHDQFPSVLRSQGPLPEPEILVYAGNGVLCLRQGYVKITLDESLLRLLALDLERRVRGLK